MLPSRALPAGRLDAPKRVVILARTLRARVLSRVAGRCDGRTRKDPAASTESTTAGWRRVGKRVRGRWCVDWQPTVPWPVVTQSVGVVPTAPVQVHDLRPGPSGRSLSHVYAIHLPDSKQITLSCPKHHVHNRLRLCVAVSNGRLDLLWCPEMSLISTPMSESGPDGHICDGSLGSLLRLARPVPVV